jgi:hypothetical protein
MRGYSWSGCSPPSAATFFVLAVVLQSLTACSSPKPKPEPTPHALRISPEFVGTWTNINPAFQNWWVITPDKVVNYGVSPDTGKCHSSEATIVAANQIDIPFGSTAQPFLYIARGKLLFDAGGQRGVHVRVTPAAICREGKSYFEGAPYPRQ